MRGEMGECDGGEGCGEVNEEVVDGAVVGPGTIDGGEEGDACGAGLVGGVKEIKEEGVELEVEATGDRGVGSGSQQGFLAQFEEEAGDVVIVLACGSRGQGRAGMLQSLLFLMFF